MPQQPRYSVKCHLTRTEYDEQMTLSLADVNRSMPILTRISEKGDHIGEHLIGRIAADAWASTTGHEISDDAQTSIELQSATWPFEDKLRFIETAGLHWTPDKDHATSHWESDNNTALAFLASFPGMFEIIRNDGIAEKSTPPAGKNL